MSIYNNIVRFVKLPVAFFHACLFQSLALAQQAQIPNSNTGIFQGNSKFSSALSSINWIITGIPVVPAVFFMVYSGAKLKDQEYGPAAAAAVGSIVCGIAAYLAHTLVA